MIATYCGCKPERDSLVQNSYHVSIRMPLSPPQDASFSAQLKCHSARMTWITDFLIPLGMRLSGRS